MPGHTGDNWDEAVDLSARKAAKNWVIKTKPNTQPNS